MRSVCAVVVALLMGILAGCTTDGPPRSKAWFRTLPAFRGPVGSDVVQLEWALIERPVGDRYLNDDLWALANEQVIPLERKDLLENNGLRIAEIGGLLPAEFQELLRSERTNPNPRRRHVRAGQVATLAVGPPRAKCDFRPQNTANGDDPRGHLDNAQFSLTVTPSLAGDGKVRLAITPQILRGEAKMVIKPAEDGSGWTRREQTVAEKFGELSWEVTLSADSYLMVGGWFKREQTYGKDCFIRIDEPRPVQRLLVIRASRQQGDAVAGDASPTMTTAALATGGAGR